MKRLFQLTAWLLLGVLQVLLVIFALIGQMASCYADDICKLRWSLKEPEEYKNFHDNPGCMTKDLPIIDHIKTESDGKENL